MIVKESGLITFSAHLVGLSLAIFVYCGVALAVVQLQGIPKRLVAAATSLAVAVLITRTILTLETSGRLADMLRLPLLTIQSIYLLFLGFLMIRHSGGHSEETVSWIAGRLGWLTVIFAVVSSAAYYGLDRLLQIGGIRISFDYIYIFLWSIISIGAFILYISRPAAGMGEDGPSKAFIQSYGITPREAVIIEHVGRGSSNQEIADSLFISFTTVRTHVYNIFRKTGAKSRVELLRMVSGYRE
ncbi:MAG: LuxR C-terminal-related transcriptional regulator [Spirochaetaceae bacterium]|nr:LuxR C-terminal-related transcriptional regulator [Spirochaetaceae bacterium]MDT8298385.1 LuxR C-terminal-related transcriptional regulator [Spirochaetaceae bacterium]